MVSTKIREQKEVTVKLADGCTVHSSSVTHEVGDYVRICNKNGEEIAYWHFNEWKEDPITVMGAIINFMAGKRIIKTVDMIASGYEWTCPNCEELNTEIEVKERLQCVQCERKYRVGETHHATD